MTTNQETREWPHHPEIRPIGYDLAGHAAGADLSAVQNQVSEILRSQYGITPKRGAITYAKPYLEAYDLLDPPPKFNINIIKHISRYLA